MHKIYWYFYQLLYKDIFLHVLDLTAVPEYFLYLLVITGAESRYFENGMQKTFLVIFTSVLFQRGRWQYEPFLTNFSGHVFFLTLCLNGHAYFVYVQWNESFCERGGGCWELCLCRYLVLSCFFRELNARGLSVPK